MLELLFTIIVMIGTVYDIIMDKKLQKKKTKTQLEKEKQIKMSKGIIKYIFIDLASIKPFETKKLEESKEQKKKLKIVKISEDKKLSQNQVVQEPPQNELEAPKKEIRKVKTLKKVKKRRKVSKYKKNTIPKPTKSSKKKARKKKKQKEQINKKLEKQPGGYLTASVLDIFGENTKKMKKNLKN